MVDSGGSAGGGTVLWTVETDDRVKSSPTVVDGSSRDTRVCQRTLGHHDRAPDGG